MRPLTESRWRTGVVFLAVLLAVLAWRDISLASMVFSGDGYGTVKEAPKVDHKGWNDEILETAEELPILDGGRLKPLITYARFTLLRTNGYAVFRRDKDLPSERIISATEWLLDIIFYPDVASKYPCIRVADKEALNLVGLEEVTKDKKKSDRYSFEELFPAIQEIDKRGEEYAKIPDTRRSSVQTQILLLRQNMLELYRLLTFGAFSRSELALDSHPGLAKLFDGAERVRMSEFIGRKDALLDRIHALSKEAEDPKTLGPEAVAIQGLLEEARGLLSLGGALRIVPPIDVHKSEETWYTPAELAMLSQIPEDMVSILADLEAMHDNRADKPAFLAALKDLQKRTEDSAAGRGEWGTISLEIQLYRLDPFFKALLCFLLGFIVIALTWIWSGSKWLRRVGVGLTTLGLLLLTYGVTLRCLIRGNPPVTNLYETVLFITGVGVLACLITEWINKRRIALALAPIIGLLGLFLAGRYEVLEGKDTIGSLVAVLRSNFWLATHVTTISIGYSAGLLAGGLGCFYVLAKAFGLKPKDPQFYPTVTRMIYGMIAFGLLFSLVGTILGGVWANDSWGRFWGWDPKENGALMIVIWNLIILHSRLAGFAKPFGIAMLAIGGGIIVGWSWWGVNLLNVGLHSYGFTQGVHDGLWIFIAVNVAAMMAAWDWHVFMRSR